MAAESMAPVREAVERAVRGWDEQGRSWEGLAARLDLARCLLGVNRHADAGALLDAVRKQAGAIGSPPITLRADEL